MKIARQRAIQLEADLASGEYAAPAKPVAIADAKKQYVDSMKAAGKAYKTILAYKAECETFVQFLHRNGAYQLTQISSKLFLAYRAERKSVLADKTLYTRLIIIKTFVNRCCGDGELLDNNPLSRCKVAMPYITPKFSPSQQQVNSILAKAVNPRLAQYAVLALHRAPCR